MVPMMSALERFHCSIKCFDLLVFKLADKIKNPTGATIMKEVFTSDILKGQMDETWSQWFNIDHKYAK